MKRALPRAGILCRVAAASTDTDVLELTEQNVETVLDEVCMHISEAIGSVDWRMLHACCLVV